MQDMKYNEINKFESKRHEALMGVWWGGLMLKKAAREYFKDQPLTETQFNVLVVLEMAKTELTQRDLSDRLLVDKSNLTGLVDRMVKNGIIVRKSVEGDRRCNVIEITTKGLKALAKAKPGYEALVKKIMSVFSDEETAELTKFMLKLHGGLDASNVQANN